MLHRAPRRCAPPPPPRTTGRGTAPVDTVPAGGDPAGTWPRRPGSATAVLGRCSRNNLHALREPYSSLHALWIYGGPPPPTFHHHVPGAPQQPARARVGPRWRRALRGGLAHVSARVRRRLRSVHHAQPAVRSSFFPSPTICPLVSAWLLGPSQIRRRSPHDAICGSRSHTVMCFLRWAWNRWMGRP